MRSRIEARPFGQLADGTPITRFTLSNVCGVEAGIITFGATLVSLTVPDRRGRMADVVLGFGTLDAYVDNVGYFGATVGRYANRIARASFELDGRHYQLSANSDANQLHGGARGFDKRVWSAETAQTPHGPALRLTRVSADGEEGFPGRLDVGVTYTLTDRNQLVIDYAAETDAPTHVCLTHHSYFNLAGHDSGTAMRQRLSIDADRYLPVGDTRLPMGTAMSVTGTPFDFRREAEIEERLGWHDPQLALGNGFDHCFVLNPAADPDATRATLHDPGSGRTLALATSEPGLQFFSGNLTLDLPGKSGRPYPFRAGICLEPEHFPDSPNRPEYPSTIVRPGERYVSRTVMAFSAI